MIDKSSVLIKCLRNILLKWSEQLRKNTSKLKSVYLKIRRKKKAYNIIRGQIKSVEIIYFKIFDNKSKFRYSVKLISLIS